MTGSGKTFFAITTSVQYKTQILKLALFADLLQHPLHALHDDPHVLNALLNLLPHPPQDLAFLIRALLDLGLDLPPRLFVHHFSSVGSAPSRPTVLRSRFGVR